MIALLVADAIGYAPLGYLAYQYQVYNSVSSYDWELFASYSIFAYVVQFFIGLIAFAISASYLSE